MSAEQKKTIIVVDDLPENISILIAALTPEYTVLGATSQAQLMTLLDKDIAPDLILLDIVMPDCDGYQVCCQLKSMDKTADVPIIFVTSKKETKDEKKGFEVGAVDYITKPIEPVVVKSRVKTHIDLYRNTLALKEHIHQQEVRERELLAIKEELAELASSDPLTGLKNRRCFFEGAEKEFLRFKRLSASFTVLMIDLDNFKSINDTYGHAAGDLVLKAFAELTQGLFRDYDIVARFGGEEFVILLPETNCDSAFRVAQRLRSQTAKHKITYQDYRIKLTASIGIAEVEKADVDINASIERADNAVYLAKKQGRNQVIVSH
ncbi:diguanylate cyclase [Catenovulum sp. SM1970]|uniref:diguanylate cyclase n=1 Tax=Marinifaba aquimaris TaxID=2741323 RepID=UPI001573F7B6|nr:diguanylate cyclase [Marinifaba aquimaris]NTS76657.1 diguanylate cyclase [Marinifaba aquimaris]